MDLPEAFFELLICPLVNTKTQSLKVISWVFLDLEVKLEVKGAARLKEALSSECFKAVACPNTLRLLIERVYRFVHGLHRVPVTLLRSWDAEATNSISLKECLVAPPRPLLEPRVYVAFLSMIPGPLPFPYRGLVFKVSTASPPGRMPSS